MIRMGVGVIEGFLRNSGVFERTPKYNISTDHSNSETINRQHIPIDKIFFLEIVYILVLLCGILKTFILGGFYIFSTFYFAFLLLSTTNLVLSEVLHAVSR